MRLSFERMLLSQRGLKEERSRRWCLRKGGTRNITFLTTMAIVTVSAGSVHEKASADSNDSNTGHQSLMAVPSMADDFVRAPELNTNNLSQPRPGDFRYLKMNYATAKDQDTEKENQGDSGSASQSTSKTPLLKPSEAGNGPTTDKTAMPSGTKGDKFGRLDLTPLGLTSEQKQKIQALRRDAGKRSRELHAVLRAKKEDLMNATFDPDQSESAIRDKRDAVRALHQQLEDLMFDEIMAIRSMLSPEQKKHLSEIKPPPTFGPPGDGLARSDATRVEGVKLDANKSATVKSDVTSKTDPSKPSSTKIDTSVKSDAPKTAASKN
jgi:periplasmic protein CpxP/Spy